MGGHISLGAKKSGGIKIPWLGADGMDDVPDLGGTVGDELQVGGDRQRAVEEHDEEGDDLGREIAEVEAVVIRE